MLALPFSIFVLKWAQRCAQTGPHSVHESFDAMPSADTRRKIEKSKDSFTVTL